MMRLPRVLAHTQHTLVAQYRLNTQNMFSNREISGDFLAQGQFPITTGVPQLAIILEVVEIFFRADWVRERQGVPP